MKRILLFLIMIFTFIVSYAETYWNYEPYTTEGTEFYVTFMMNGGDNDGDGKLEFYLYASTRNTSVKDVTITVTNPSTGWNTTFTCNSNSVGQVSIPDTEGYLSEEDMKMERGLIVTSTAPISLYASNYGSDSYAAANVLPVKALSKEYVIQTYSYDRYATEIAIVAMKDGTVISIDPKNDNIKKKDGSHYTESFTIKLDKGDAYLLRGEGKNINLDLSGTVICSNYPIAVFNGGQATIIPAKVGSDDHIIEQSLPTYMWGKEFVVTNSAAHEFNIVKITAMYDGTIIYVDSQQEIILNKKESFQFAMGNVAKLDKNDSTKKIINKNALYIKSSYPTICFSYHTDEYIEDCGYADPSMVFIPPLEQRINEISFLTHNVDNEETHHFVNIVTKTADVNKIKLDEGNIPSDFLPVPGNALYSYARKKLDKSGSHKITSTGDGFLAYAYGARADAAEAYGYNVGNTLLPMGAYMLLKGKRVNEMGFCYNEKTDIEAVINYDYDKIEWFLTGDDNPDTTFYNWDGKKLQIPIPEWYDTTGVYDIKMVVTKRNILCLGTTDCPDCGNTQDTVSAKLRIFDTYNVPLPTQYICDGDSIVWEYKYMKDSVIAAKDSIIKIGGEFKMNLLSKYGCDSIITLRTIIVPKPDTLINISECECKLPYILKHKDDTLDVLTQSKVYNYTLESVHKCDSFVTVNFTVNPCYNMPQESATICENDTIIWQKKKYYKGNGFYKADTTYFFYDSLRTKKGCDSVYSLKLYVAPTYYFDTDTIEMCDDEVRKWEGHLNDTIFQNIKAGTYYIYDSLKTKQYQCDSIHKLTLIVHSTSLQSEIKEICQDDTFVWRGKNIPSSTPGIYTIRDTSMTNSGCLSIHELLLTIHPSYIFDIEKDTVCISNLKYYQWTDHNDVISNFISTFNPISESEGTFYTICDSNKTKVGCDSIYTLELYVAPIYHEYDTASICDGDPYFWEVTGETYYVTGDYDTTLTSQFGCDSICHLHLMVGKKWFIEEDTVNICDNEEYTWQGHKNDTIFSDFNVGQYVIYDSLKTDFFGCDSVHRLVINVYPTYFEDEGRDTVCITELSAYKWERHESKTFNFDFTKGDTTYVLYDSLQTKVLHACDSIHKLELYVAPIFHKDTTVEICDRDSFYWDVTKEFYYVQGVYNYGTTTACGCDSTFTLNLIVNPVYDKDTTVRICHCNPYVYPGEYFGGDMLSMPGLYSDTLFTIHGCDSILNLTLIVDSCYEFLERDTVCFDKSYVWKNHEKVKIYWPKADSTYTYYDSLKTIHGCDSVYILELFIQPTYRNYITVNLCDNDSYEWMGETFDKARVESLIGSTNDIYSFTAAFERCVKTKAGCDSCNVLFINMHKTYFYEETVSICENDTFTWINHKMGHNSDTTFRNLSTGMYIIYDSLHTNIFKCDSVYKLNLVVLDTFFNDTTIYLCENDVYIWEDHKNDTIFKDLESGKHTYYDSLTTIYGCDSIYRLNLVVRDTFFIEEDVVVCFNDLHPGYEHKWEGHDKIKINIKLDIADTTYVIYDSLKTEFGCDSIFKLNLIISPKIDTTFITDTICCGDYYYLSSILETTLLDTMKTKKLNQPGTYYYRYNSKRYPMCDSIVVLQLDTITPTKIDVTILDICADDDSLIIPYTYKGRKPIKYSVIFDEEALDQKFVNVDHDSIKNDSVLLVPVPRVEGDRQKYPRPDRYNATIFLHNGICSDSLVMEKESFMIRYPSWITEQHWNDVISLLNDKYNGGYTFSKYQWFHNGVPILGEDSSYIYQPLVMGDEYYAELTRTDDGKTIATCPIYPTMVEDSVIPYPYAEVIPNIVNKNYPYAEIKSVEDGEYWIYNAFALPDGPYEFISPSTEIKLPTTSGVYIIVFETKEHGRRHIQRVIVK